MDGIVWEDWTFMQAEDSPIFGKMKVIARRDDLEEVFYIYCEELTKEVCEDLYNEHLYAYG